MIGRPIEFLNASGRVLRLHQKAPQAPARITATAACSRIGDRGNSPTNPSRRRPLGSAKRMLSGGKAPLPASLISSPRKRGPVAGEGASDRLRAFHLGPAFAGVSCCAGRQTTRSPKSALGERVSLGGRRIERRSGRRRQRGRLGGRRSSAGRTAILFLTPVTPDTRRTINSA